MSAENLPAGWKRCLSKKYQKHFYYHAESKRSVWVHPALLNKDKVNGQERDSLESNSHLNNSTDVNIVTLAEKDREVTKRKKDERNTRITNWAQGGSGHTIANNNKVSKSKKQKELSSIEKRTLKIQAKKEKLQKLLEDASKRKLEKTQPSKDSELKKPKTSTPSEKLTPAMRKVLKNKEKDKEQEKSTASSDKKSRYQSYSKKNGSITLNKISLKHKSSKSMDGAGMKKLKETVLKSDGILDQEATKRIKELKPIPKKTHSRKDSGSSMNSIQSSSEVVNNPFLSSKSTSNTSVSSSSTMTTEHLFTQPVNVNQSTSSTSTVFQNDNNPFQQTVDFQTISSSRENIFAEQGSVFESVSRRESVSEANAFVMNTDLNMQESILLSQLEDEHGVDEQGVDEGMEIDDAAEMSREIMKEIRGIREENIVTKPQVNEAELAQDLPAYSDPLYIVVDTNILLSHLKFISELKDYPFPGVGAPYLVIPWMVFQELDNLKDAVNRRHTQVHEDGEEEKSFKLNVLARQAIKFISACLQGDHPRVKGESVMEASMTIEGFVEEMNDDSIIHCCLGLKTRAAHSHIVMLSNDRNLCNKAIVMGVKAFSQQNVLLGLRSLFQSGTVAVRKENFEEYFEEYKIQEVLAKRRKQADDLSCEIQCILREGFSSIIETEMKEAYGDELWLQIIKITPPWTLNDVFTLLQRHWIAVFGLIVERTLIKIIEDLKKKFISGEGSPGNLETVKEMLELSLKIFEGFTVRSNYGDMLTKCITGVKVLLAKCLEYIKQAVPLKTLPSTRALEGPQTESAPQPNQERPSNDTEQKDLDNLTPYERVLETFNAIWRTVTHFSALIFYSLDFPSALIKELNENEVKPSPQESLACLSTMTPCLLNLIKMLQGVIHIPVEGLAQQEESILNLLASIYSFMKDVMKRDCSIKPQELLQFCQDTKTRTALVQGLSQLDRSYATLQQCAEYHQTVR